MRFPAGLSMMKKTVILKPEMAIHIYYIAREAAYNAVKHGNAANILLSLFKTGTTATLQIKDDGCGLPDNIDNRGMGIRIMNYRARRIGAALDIRRGTEAGTQITLSFNPDIHGENNSNDTSIKKLR